MLHAGADLDYTLLALHAGFAGGIGQQRRPAETNIGRTAAVVIIDSLGGSRHHRHAVDRHGSAGIDGGPLGWVGSLGRLPAEQSECDDKNSEKSADDRFHVYPLSLLWLAKGTDLADNLT